MYRLFVESIKNYFEMNKGEMSTRLLRAEPLLLLTDIRSFEEKKRKNCSCYLQAVRLLDRIGTYREESGALGTLAWELAGSGYPLGGADRVNCTDEKDEVLEEQMKLVNLFLNSTAYWPKEKNQITAAADTFKNEVEGQKE